MTHGEAAEVLGVSPKTVQRRLNRALHLLSDCLSDLQPWPSHDVAVEVVRASSENV